MPVPKRKVSRSRRDKRSANKGLSPKTVASCQTCQEPVMPHCVCIKCGYYKGEKILRTKDDRMYDRGQARQARQAKAEHIQPEVVASQVEEAGKSETDQK